MQMEAYQLCGFIFLKSLFHGFTGEDDEEATGAVCLNLKAADEITYKCHCKMGLDKKHSCKNTRPAYVLGEES